MKNYISYNKTDIKLNKNIIYKKYKIRTIPKKNVSLVNKNILNYYKLLKKNLIPVPKLISHNKNLEYSFEYCGESLSELLKKKYISKKRMNLILEEISKILDKCEKMTIDLDPHFKNFTLKNNRVFYVDLFPPMTNEYRRLLIQINPNIKNLISKHLDTYKYNLIKHHFLADLKKTKNINKDFYFYSKKFFIVKGILNKINYKLINKIIKIENKNLNSKDFTLS